MAASGVRVGTSDTRGVPFGEIAGKKEITGSTTAAATAQPLTEGQSPFMVSAPAPGHPVNPLNPDDSVNNLAVGYYYVLQGNPMKEEGRDCDNDASNWRGSGQLDQKPSISTIGGRLRTGTRTATSRAKSPVTTLAGGREPTSTTSPTV